MITGRGDCHKRVAALEAGNPPRTTTGNDDAMPLIWEVLEQYPLVKSTLEKIKGINDMSDEEALPLMMETLDNNPDIKAAIVSRLKQEQVKG